MKKIITSLILVFALAVRSAGADTGREINFDTPIGWIGAELIEAMNRAGMSEGQKHFFVELVLTDLDVRNRPTSLAQLANMMSHALVLGNNYDYLIHRQNRTLQPLLHRRVRSREDNRVVTERFLNVLVEIVQENKGDVIILRGHPDCAEDPENPPPPAKVRLCQLLVTEHGFTNSPINCKDTGLYCWITDGTTTIECESGGIGMPPTCEKRQGNVAVSLECERMRAVLEMAPLLEANRNAVIGACGGTRDTNNFISTTVFEHCRRQMTEQTDRRSVDSLQNRCEAAGVTGSALAEVVTAGLMHLCNQAIAAARENNFSDHHMRVAEENCIFEIQEFGLGARLTSAVRSRLNIRQGDARRALNDLLWDRCRMHVLAINDSATEQSYRTALRHCDGMSEQATRAHTNECQRRLNNFESRITGSNRPGAHEYTAAREICNSGDRGRRQEFIGRLNELERLYGQVRR
ncbi:MAG: hypothetical protein FWE64_02120 [Alphaproteobacteria bacterium]|nr:hypothetical protein [Alphaproteobacteria bacterium]